MGMANIDCANCGHSMSEHESRDFGPTLCTVEGCDWRSGPAQRDDLVDIILDQKEFLVDLKGRSDLTSGDLHGHIYRFLCSLEERLENIK